MTYIYAHARGGISSTLNTASVQTFSFPIAKSPVFSMIAFMLLLNKRTFFVSVCYVNPACCHPPPASTVSR